MEVVWLIAPFSGPGSKNKERGVKTNPHDSSEKLQFWTEVLGHLHFFSENCPSLIPPPPPLSKLSQQHWPGGETSVCVNVTVQSVQHRVISEYLSCFQAVQKTFVQDCTLSSWQVYHSTIYSLIPWLIPDRIIKLRKDMRSFPPLLGSWYRVVGSSSEFPSHSWFHINRICHTNQTEHLPAIPQSVTNQEKYL